MNNNNTVITQANLLNTHPSTQDLNIISGQTLTNPIKQQRDQFFRNRNQAFMGDNYAFSGGKVLAPLDAPVDSKGQKDPTRSIKATRCGNVTVVATRNEINIRKGVKPPSVVDVTTNSNKNHLTSPPLQRQQQKQQQQLPPRSPVAGGGNLAAASSSSSSSLSMASSSNKQQQQQQPKISAREAEKLNSLEITDLLRHAAKRRKPNATPSEISLVTTVESRDASTNHPASETVYTCSCCRPRKPRSSCASSSMASGYSSSRGGGGGVYREDGSEDASLYENLTSISQRGGAHPAKPVVTNELTKKVFDERITAKAIFELQQAKAGAGGSLGHNLTGASGRSLNKPMGFGLQSARSLPKPNLRFAAMDAAAAAASSQASAVSSLTITTRASSRASSGAVRKLEDALEQEKQDRLRTEAQIDKIRQRQEALMKTLTEEEKKKMKEILGHK